MEVMGLPTKVVKVSKGKYYRGDILIFKNNSWIVPEKEDFCKIDAQGFPVFKYPYSSVLNHVEDGDEVEILEIGWKPNEEGRIF